MLTSSEVDCGFKPWSSKTLSEVDCGFKPWSSKILSEVDCGFKSWSSNECILFTLLLFNHWLILIKKLIISTKLAIPLDSRHQTTNKWNETIPTLFSRLRICSTVFIFVTVSITSLYNGGLKNGNFVVKIFRCFTVNS
jgi:hypothetical protein